MSSQKFRQSCVVVVVVVAQDEATKKKTNVKNT